MLQNCTPVFTSSFGWIFFPFKMLNFKCRTSSHYIILQKMYYTVTFSIIRVWDFGHPALPPTKPSRSYFESSVSAKHPTPADSQTDSNSTSLDCSWWRQSLFFWGHFNQNLQQVEVCSVRRYAKLTDRGCTAERALAAAVQEGETPWRGSWLLRMLLLIA